MRAKHSTSSVFLPASVFCVQVIHTACVCFAWEQGMQRRLSRGLIARSARASLCVCFAPERPSSPGRVLSLAFLAALAPLPLRRSKGGARGVRSGIWWRDRRRASLYLHPHLSDLMTALRDRKPALRLLPLGQRPRRFSCLPPRRLTRETLSTLHPLFHPNMRSWWR